MLSEPTVSLVAHMNNSDIIEDHDGAGGVGTWYELNRTNHGYVGRKKT